MENKSYYDPATIDTRGSDSLLDGIISINGVVYKKTMNNLSNSFVISTPFSPHRMINKILAGLLLENNRKKYYLIIMSNPLATASIPLPYVQNTELEI